LKFFENILFYKLRKERKRREEKRREEKRREKREFFNF